MALVDLLARLSARTVTPVTPCNPDGVTANPAPIKACTLVTSVTPQIGNSRYAALADDDRRRCNECVNLAGLRCLAAARGDLPMTARTYEPDAERLHRCPRFMEREGEYMKGEDDGE